MIEEKIESYSYTMTLIGSCDREVSMYFNVVIKNPCFDSSVILTPDNLADFKMTYLIRSDPYSRDNWKSAFSLLYPQCGELSFNLLDIEDIPLEESTILSRYMTYDSSELSPVLTVSTNDMYAHADYTVKVEAQLADNDDIKAQPVELIVTLKNCDVNSIEYPIFGGSESVINIRFDGTEHTTHFDEFVA